MVGHFWYWAFWCFAGVRSASVALRWPMKRWRPSPPNPALELFGAVEGVLTILVAAALPFFVPEIAVPAACLALASLAQVAQSTHAYHRIPPMVRPAPDPNDPPG